MTLSRRTFTAAALATPIAATLPEQPPGRGDGPDRERLEQRLATADVLLTAMRPAALDRLGLRKSVARHRLVHVEIVGYDGERAGEAGPDGDGDGVDVGELHSGGVARATQ